MSATISINLNTIIPSFFSWLFFGKQAKKHHYQISFGPEAAAFGEHGALVGTWFREGYKEPITIPFYIQGYKMAPRLDYELMKEIYHHASMVGIVVSHLYSYNGLAAPKKQS
jgi:hypothetical protein